MKRWLTWWRQLVRPEPIPPTPSLLVEPAVLGVTMTEPVVIAPSYRTMAFRGQTWLQHEPADASGVVTFTREVSVDGRAVQSELRVHERDLVARGDIYFIEGRD